MPDVAQILAERGPVHGDFTDNADVAQGLKFVMHNQKNWLKMDFTKREALDLIALKLSRILTGDFEYADNWDDIAGYCKLVKDRLKK